MNLYWLLRKTMVLFVKVLMKIELSKHQKDLIL